MVNMTAALQKLKPICIGYFLIEHLKPITHWEPQLRTFVPVVGLLSHRISISIHLVAMTHDTSFQFYLVCWQKRKMRSFVQNFDDGGVWKTVCDCSDRPIDRDCPILAKCRRKTKTVT